MSKFTLFQGGNLRHISHRMEVLILLIALSLLIALGFLAAFIWATRDGQYDDEETPAIRMLHDNHPQKAKTE